MNRRLALLFLGLIAGCASDTAGPPIEVPVPPPERHIPDFFSAFSWYGSAYTSPILTQPYDVSQCPDIPGWPCLDDALYRQQWNDVWAWQEVATWAAHPDHRGHLYIVGDAVHGIGGFGGIYIEHPRLFAEDYCEFVRGVRAVDSTAKFSPALIEPWVTEEWLNELVAGLLVEYQAGRCSTNPVAEWEFNFYGKWSLGFAAFQEYVNRWAAWSTANPAPMGAPMVFSAWTLAWFDDNIANDDPAYLDRLRRAKAFLFAHKDVIHSRYLLYEPWPYPVNEPHPLADVNGKLTATGRVYAEVTARIAGPASVRPGERCRWIAETTGGSRPFKYQWVVDGRPVDGGDEHWLDYARSSGFTVRLIVTDVTGGYSVATVSVVANESAPACAS